MRPREETPPPRRGRPKAPSSCHRLRETPPPRRGRLFPGSAHRTFPGNTPAEAGKTKHGTEAHSQKAKHPRRGGEDLSMCLLGRRRRETPPPRRGRRESEGISGFRVRNTPAEAGKTNALHLAFHCVQKHPRRGGEDELDGLRKVGLVETPPPRRGRLSVRVPIVQKVGNTPAEAGKTIDQ